MPVVRLTRGKTALVDKRDFAFLSQFKWRVAFTRKQTYAVRNISQNETLTMHRQILGLSKGDGKTGDHLNGNGLDNRRCNLRVATATDQRRNLHRTNGKSGSIGVVRIHRGAGRLPWLAQLRHGQKHLLAKRFATKKEAVLAYNQAAEKYGFLTRSKP